MMRNFLLRLYPRLLVLLLCSALGNRPSVADEIEKADGWLIDHAANTHLQTHSFEMVLHPQSEPRPALRYRLTPDRYDQVTGNAAIFYLKALGFFEETAARQAVEQFERSEAEKASQTGAREYAPYAWMTTPPDDLPVKEVQAFLKLLDFQEGYVREATKRRTFSLDRDIRNNNDPLTYLLPEIQVMRQLSRYQVLRTRVAIAEERIDDAIEILGQQYALAHHLGNDEFFVSNLVGAAIGSMAWNDAVHLLNQPKTPNLYWAFASLPKPLIDMREAASLERQFLFEQVKCLREVTEKIRPVGYWQDFLDRFEQQLLPILNFEGGWQFPEDPDERRVATVSTLAAAYPGARKFLSEIEGMSDQQLDEYSHIQVSLLAMRRYYEYARDEQFKWDYVPYPNAQGEYALPALSDSLHKDKLAYGWITEPANLLLPAVIAIRTAQLRNEQQIAMLQTVEALRDHAANHDGLLPQDLSQTRLPSPSDPISGKPFTYTLRRQTATLLGAPASSFIQYQLVLRVAP